MQKAISTGVKNLLYIHSVLLFIWQFVVNLHQNNGASTKHDNISSKILDEIAKKLQIKKKSWMKSLDCG